MSTFPIEESRREKTVLGDRIAFLEHTVAIKLRFLTKLSDTSCGKRNIFMLSLNRHASIARDPFHQHYYVDYRSPCSCPWRSTLKSPWPLHSLLLCDSDYIDRNGIELQVTHDQYDIPTNSTLYVPLSSSINPWCPHLHPIVLAQCSV